MGVPWETIIKVFRKRLDRKSFNNLKDYSTEFLGFIGANRLFFPLEAQEEFFRQSVGSFFSIVRKNINRKVEDIIAAEGSISETKVSQVAEENINNSDEWVKSAERLTSVPDGHEKVLIDSYAGVIENAIADVFQKLPLTVPLRNLLVTTAASLFTRKRFSLKHSGVVIAGFGDEDIFPSVVQHNIDGLACDVLKYEATEDGVSLEQSSLIIPFAQRETVDAFMTGLDPRLEMVIFDFLKALFGEMPDRIRDLVGNTFNVDPTNIHTSLREITQSLYKSFQEGLEQEIRSRYVQPVLDAVESLPKDELAAMAESLVNLTSFKQKVSLQQETVGGPIDVAVISKGDGFVWIKRKHYFIPELNPRFVAKYYGLS